MIYTTSSTLFYHLLETVTMQRKFGCFIVPCFNSEEIRKFAINYSRVPNKRTGAFNRTEGKKQPELISVQCTINVQRGLNCQN